MNILVTGSAGFVGTNLCYALKNIRDGLDRTRPSLHIESIFEYDRGADPNLQGTDSTLLAKYCKNADFVFHLAGVNRPKDPAEFMEGNFGFTSVLLKTLRDAGNSCPIMLASSVQASLEGRFAGSPYGESKLAGEKLFVRYGQETGARVLIYRFPNLFGKWCRPGYNSAVATFCHNIARDLPITVNDPSTELELLYIDDLVAEMLDALEGREHRGGCVTGTGEGRRHLDGGSTEDADVSKFYCVAPGSHRATLGAITDLLTQFHDQPQTLLVPEIPAGSFAAKLYSTYLSYLPKEKTIFPLTMHSDDRGSFTELLRTVSGGQFSVNISKPGITKGEHWHHSKWEFFVVVSGHALIRERKIGTDEIWDFEVSGDRIEAVHMLPGYTHNIINLSDTEDLVTLMWANESFDPGKPDTYREPVELNN